MIRSIALQSIVVPRVLNTQPAAQLADRIAHARQHRTEWAVADLGDFLECQIVIDLQDYNSLLLLRQAIDQQLEVLAEQLAFGLRLRSDAVVLEQVLALALATLVA